MELLKALSGWRSHSTRLHFKPLPIVPVELRVECSLLPDMMLNPVAMGAGGAVPAVHVVPQRGTQGGPSANRAGCALYTVAQARMLNKDPMLRGGGLPAWQPHGGKGATLTLSTGRRMPRTRTELLRALAGQDKSLVSPPRPTAGDGKPHWCQRHGWGDHCTNQCNLSCQWEGAVLNAAGDPLGDCMYETFSGQTGFGVLELRRMAMDMLQADIDENGGPPVGLDLSVHEGVRTIRAYIRRMRVSAAESPMALHGDRIALECLARALDATVIFDSSTSDQLVTVGRGSAYTIYVKYDGDGVNGHYSANPPGSLTGAPAGGPELVELPRCPILVTEFHREVEAARVAIRTYVADAREANCAFADVAFYNGAGEQAAWTAPQLAAVDNAREGMVSTFEARHGRATVSAMTARGLCVDILRKTRKPQYSYLKDTFHGLENIGWWAGWKVVNLPAGVKLWGNADQVKDPRAQSCTASPAGVCIVCGWGGPVTRICEEAGEAGGSCRTALIGAGGGAMAVKGGGVTTPAHCYVSGYPFCYPTITGEA